MKLILPVLVFLSLSFSFFACTSGSQSIEVDSNTSVEDEKIISPASDSDSDTPKQVLTSEGGRSVSVYSYQSFAEAFLENKNDTTYVLNFWATWCGPCVAELPYFLELEQKLKGKKIKFIFVSFDDLKDLDKKLLPFIDKREMNSKIVVLDQAGANDWLEKIDKDWGGSIPATLVYNKSRRDFFEQSFDTLEELEKTLSIE